MSKKVVLAFSGGLDTSYCVVLLKDQGYEVTTVLVDTGGLGEDEKAQVQKRAEELGTSKHVVIDARVALYDRYISYLIKGNYQRNGSYPGVVGVERYIQAEAVTKFAIAEGVDALAHGSTGAGGDHVRFDVVIRTLAPNLEIITPIREGEVKRETSTAYLRERGFHVDDKTLTYSVNEGLAGTSIGGGETYNSWGYLPEEAWVNVKSVADAPDDGAEIVIRFDNGLPIACETADGEVLAKAGSGEPSYAVLALLNTLSAQHGIGRGVHTGMAIAGNPARLGFEAPGLLTIIAAHRELERAVLTPRQQNAKAPLGAQYGDMIHEALYYDPLMDDIAAFLDSSQTRVTGDVRVKLLKGNVICMGTRSPFSLIEAGRRNGAIYGHSSSMWTGVEARAFAHLYSIQGAIASAAKEGHDGSR
jgi:argininosuccinate synthase